MMLFMSGMCFILIIMTLMPDIMSYKRKRILALMELACTALLLCDRMSYLSRGDASTPGGYIVRFSNGMVFFLTILVPLLVTYVLRDLYKNEGGLLKPPRELWACEVLFIIGTVLIIVTQFTGLYYVFDENNVYHRAPGIVISYVLSFLIVIIQEYVILRNRELLSKNLVNALTLCLALPTFASILQYFNYGLSLTNMTMVLVVIVFYMYELSSVGKEVRNARKREIDSYKESQRREAALFLQTTEALASAIDAKDEYTHGHSMRVAALSRRIAREAGYSDDQCEQVYFAALLHDVGKIGVPDDVINKPGKLTDEEFRQIKIHPVLGHQILSTIKQSPYLSIGARYHHERYDGKGYPDGLRGEQIPELARIIAVADAYDAMTSTRSYRDALAYKRVRDEIEKGRGTQFDERFATILLQLIDEGEVQ